MRAPLRENPVTEEGAYVPMWLLQSSSFSRLTTVSSPARERMYVSVLSTSSLDNLAIAWESCRSASVTCDGEEGEVCGVDCALGKRSSSRSVRVSSSSSLSPYGSPSLSSSSVNFECVFVSSSISRQIAFLSSLELCFSTVMSSPNLCVSALSLAAGLWLDPLSLSPTSPEGALTWDDDDDDDEGSRDVGLQMCVLRKEMRSSQASRKHNRKDTKDIRSSRRVCRDSNTPCDL